METAASHMGIAALEMRQDAQHEWLARHAASPKNRRQVPPGRFRITWQLCDFEAFDKTLQMKAPVVRT